MEVLDYVFVACSWSAKGHPIVGRYRRTGIDFISFSMSDELAALLDTSHIAKSNRLVIMLLHILVVVEGEVLGTKEQGGQDKERQENMKLPFRFVSLCI